MSNDSAKKSYEKHKNDPDYITRHAEYSKKSYEKRKNDPDFKLKRGEVTKKFNELNEDYVKKRAQAYRQRPEVKKRHAIQQKMYHESKVEEIKQQSRDKYRDDEVHREAMKAYGKQYKEQNSKAVKIKDHERKLRLKLEIYNHYSNNNIRCRCCNETEIMFLSLDHIEGGGNRHRKALGKTGINFLAWLKKVGFPDGYQILCMNCNWGKSKNNNICPHKTRT